MKKFALSLACIAIVAVIALPAKAASVTSRGETISVTLLSENPEGSTTVTKDESVWPRAGVDRRGIYVIHYEVPAAGITGAVDLVDWEIPKGTIFEEDAIIEVQTAILPDAGTAALACGGVTLLAAGNDLESTGIKDLDVGPAITTADDKPYITIAGTTATSGVFTVYLPVILGNAQ